MVNYFDSSSGYLAYPSSVNLSNKKIPGIIMIHENRGLNTYIKDMANTLARQGFVVLAVDLFKGQMATNNNQARLYLPLSEITNRRLSLIYNQL